MTIREQLAALRRKRGLTQKALAERVGVPQPRIAELETGQGDVYLSRVVDVAEALGARVDLRETKRAQRG